MEKRWGFGQTYNFRRLVATRRLENFSHKNLQIVCDIDKTYLETNFSGTLQLIKIAFEQANQKVTVPGAATFLRALRWYNPDKALSRDSEHNQPHALHFVSASPPQLRRTLDEKLRRDGLDWSTDSFKNQAYNLRKGRLGFLRHHVAYKTATVLKLIDEAPPKAKFVLIGDSAELDSYIYIGLTAYLNGNLTDAEYIDYLKIGGVNSEVAEDLKSVLRRNRQTEVAAILIRKVPGHRLNRIPPITDAVYFFDNYLNATLVMLVLGFVDSAGLASLVREFHDISGYTIYEILLSLKRFEPILPEEYVRDLIEELAMVYQRLHNKAFSSEILTKPNLSPSPVQITVKGPELLLAAKRWAQVTTQNYKA